MSDITQTWHCPSLPSRFRLLDLGPDIGGLEPEQIHCPGRTGYILESRRSRPEDIDTREEFGHWEMDTVVGKRGESKHSLLVLTERKTRNELIYLLYEHTTEQVCKRLDQLEAEWGERFGQVFKTITVDNGSEFADWKGMQQSAADESEKRVTVFYCHPYCSFERGSNENQNRLVRRKIPKGENFDDRTEDDIQRVEDWINDYPREMFGWKTSGELFQEELARLA